MGKIIKYFAVVISVAILLTGCGQPAVEQPTVEPMTETEQLLYDIMCEKAKNFFSPTSVKLLAASDIISANTKEEYNKIRAVEFSDSQLYYYCPFNWGCFYNLLKVQLVAETKGGGTDNKVYCINISKNDNVVDPPPPKDFEYPDLGSMWCCICRCENRSCTRFNRASAAI